MSKFCTECKLKHSNDAEKCVRCGAPLQENKAGKKMKMIILFSILGAVLIAAIVWAVIYFTSPEAKVRSIMEDLKDGDIEGVVDTFPDFFVNQEGVGRELLVQELRPWAEGLSEYIFSYNIDRVENPSTRQENDLLQSLEQFKDSGYDPEKLTDIKVVWLDMRGGTVGFWGSSFEKFVLIKYDGEWCWWPFYLV